jgi:NAD-dependent SIR2 family protein deacetylase
VTAAREFDQLRALADGRRLVALAGAGLSTDSGIPDYRGAGRPPRTPLVHRDFLASGATRCRYWARSFLGWPRVSAAAPNDGHRAVAALEHAGHLCGVITQNVDGLHQRAGSRRVIELHGALAHVRCLGCGALERRDAVQERLAAINADWRGRADAVAPAS